MTELRRLLGGEGDQLEVALLNSARDDAPSASARSKSLVALGLGASVTAAAASASSTASATGVSGTAAALKSGAGLNAVAKGAAIGAQGATAAAQAGAVASTVGKGMVIVKWVGIASVGTVSTWAVVDQVSEPEPVTAAVVQNAKAPHAQAPKASNLPSKIATKPVESDEELPEPEETTTDDQTKAIAAVPPAVLEMETDVRTLPPSAAAYPAAKQASPQAARIPVNDSPRPPQGPQPSPSPAAEEQAPSTGLSDELAALDRAQKAIHAGDGDAALAAIDNYDQRFSKKQLGLEARVLRIEATLGQGKHERARDLARDFLAAHPDSPYAQRVRHLAKQADER